MFFKKFFSKDCGHYLDKGNKYLADERYADARQEFLEALSRVGANDPDNSVRAGIVHKLEETGNRLGMMNLAEAEQCLKQGNAAKALEHLNLLLELAKDSALREQASTLMTSLDTPAGAEKAASSSSHCGTCAPAPGPAADMPGDDHLSEQERFELAIQTLPGGLSKRYAALGDTFMSAYLMIHGGKETAGAGILQDMLKDQENDILLYELAVISYRTGDPSRCEDLLHQALAINDENPLCYLSLVQLLADTGRFEEAVPLLHHMVDRTILIEQALIFLGDIHQRMGNDDEAIAEFSKALSYPGVAKASAERLVPLLSKQGRLEDAAFVIKKYLKGCC